MDKKRMLEDLILYYSRGNKSEFAKMIGMTPQGISTWLSRSTFDPGAIFAKCVGVNAEWLLTGEGEMIKPAQTGLGSNFAEEIIASHRQLSIANRDLAEANRRLVAEINDLKKSEK